MPRYVLLDLNYFFKNVLKCALFLLTDSNRPLLLTALCTTPQLAQGLFYWSYFCTHSHMIWTHSLNLDLANESAHSSRKRTSYNRPFPNYVPLPTNRNIKSRPSAKSTANVWKLALSLDLKVLFVSSGA